MTKKTIVIIGAGKEQQRAYEIAKKLKLTVIGVDKNKEAPALKYADFKINISVRKILDIKKKLNFLLDKKRFVALMEFLHLQTMFHIQYLVCQNFLRQDQYLFKVL